MTIDALTMAIMAALAVGFLTQPVVVRTMISYAVIDRPGERSSHTVPTPRGGGVATVLAAVIGLLVAPGPRCLCCHWFCSRRIFGGCRFPPA